MDNGEQGREEALADMNEDKRSFVGGSLNGCGKGQYAYTILSASAAYFLLLPHPSAETLFLH